MPEKTPLAYLRFVDEGRHGVVVTAAGIFLATNDGGKRWERVHLPKAVRTTRHPDWIDAGDFTAFTFDDSLERGRWVGLCDIHRTTDGGLTWTRHGGDLLDHEMESRCVDEAVEVDGRFVLAAVSLTGRILTSGTYLYRSQDDGESWTEVCSLDEVGLLLDSVAYCEDMADELPGWDQLTNARAFYDKDLMAWMDGADDRVLHDRSHPLPDGVDPTIYDGWTRDQRTGRLWFHADRHLAWSDDEGTTWNVVRGGLRSFTEPELDFSFGGGIGLAHDGCQVLVTRDHGRVWRARNPPGGCVYGLVAGGLPRRLVAVTPSGPWASNDLGESWGLLGDAGFEGYGVQDTEGLLWVRGNEATHASTDGGRSWLTLGFEGYFDPYQQRCAGRECLLRDSYAIRRYRLEDDGGWAELARFELSEAEDDREFIDFETDETLMKVWLLRDDGIIYRSRDGGRQFGEQTRLRTSSWWSDIERSPNGRSLLVFGEESQLAHSTDGGETFEESRIELLYGRPDGICWINDSTVLMDSDEGLLLSTDGGATWALTDIHARAHCAVTHDRIHLPGWILRRVSALATDGKP